MKPEGLDLIKEVRANPGKYLPMIDHTEEVPRRNEYGDVNIGWNAGLLEENRPYFAECWAADGITMLTVFISTKGIENKTPAELEERLLKTGYFRYREANHAPAEVMVFTNPAKEDFFSVNICVGIGDEPALIDGAPLLPWSVLNAYNKAADGYPIVPYFRDERSAAYEPEKRCCRRSSRPCRRRCFRSPR